MADDPKRDPGNKLAVALRYDRGRDPLPRVVAVGRAALARRLIEEATAHGVPIREDGDLVSMLARVEVGERIPVEAIVGVAEVIAWVWRAEDRWKRKT